MADQDLSMNLRAAVASWLRSEKNQDVTHVNSIEIETEHYGTGCTCCDECEYNTTIDIWYKHKSADGREVSDYESIDDTGPYFVNFLDHLASWGRQS